MLYQVRADILVLIIFMCIYSGGNDMVFELRTSIVTDGGGNGSEGGRERLHSQAPLAWRPCSSLAHYLCHLRHRREYLSNAVA